MALRKRTDLLVVHVSATPPSRDIGAKEIDAIHRARGWTGNGYQFVIRRDGTVERGRAENQVGAHVAGWNSVSIGICLVGGVDAAGRPQDNRTPAQSAALAKLLRELVQKYPGAKICGHRDLSPDRDRDGIIEPHEWLKACPCFDAIPWARSVGLPAAEIKGVCSKAKQRTVPAPGPDERAVYLQKLLVRAGYEFGPVDGMVGPKTRAAIKRFQAAADFEQTGAFDERTVKRLRQMFEASTVTVEKAVEVEKPVVPYDVELEVKEKTGLWSWFTAIVGSGGAGATAILGADWKTMLAIGGVALAGLLILIVLGAQLVKAIGRIRQAVEQG